MLVCALLTTAWPYLSPISEESLPKTPTTLEIRATTIDKALSQIGNPLKLEFEVDKSLSNEVVAVKVNHVRTDELLSRIADLLASKFEHKDGKWKLVPDEAKEKAAKETADQANIRLAKAVLEAAKAEVANQQPWSNRLAQDTADAALAFLKSKDPHNLGSGYETQRSKMLAIGNDTPGTRATYRMLASLSPEQIAMAYKGRTVFSDRPTPYQYPLPAQAKQIVSNWITEQNSYAETMEAKLDPPDPEKTWSKRGLEPADHGYEAAQEPLLRAEKASGTPARTLLSLKTLYDGFQARLMVAGPTGEFMVQGYACIKSQPDADAPGVDEIRKVRIGEESVELCRTLKFPTKDRPEMSETLKAKVLRPDQNDPLSFAATDVVFGLPKSKSANIVALLPDNFFDVVHNLGSYGEVNLRDLEASCNDRRIAAWSESEGWFTFAPQNIANARLLRLDRPATATFFKHVVIEKRWTLDQLIRFRRTNPSRQIMGFEASVLSCFEPAAYQLIMRNNETALKILAMLPESQYLDVANGRKLSIGLTSPDVQRNILRRLLLMDRVERGTERIALLYWDDDRDKAETDYILGQMRSGKTVEIQHDSLIHGSMGFLSDETTEILAKGISTSAYLAFYTKRQPCVFVKSESGNAFHEWQEKSYSYVASDIAVARKRPSQYKMPTQFKVGWKSPKYVVLEVVPGWSETFGLYEDSFDGNEPYVPFNSLPLDVQKAINDELGKIGDIKFSDE